MKAARLAWFKGEPEINLAKLVFPDKTGNHHENGASQRIALVASTAELPCCSGL